MWKHRDAAARGAAEYKGMVEAFKEGSLTPEQFAKGRGLYGVYAQRVPGTYMVRVRIPGGILDLDGLELVLGAARARGLLKVHATTRQDIQFHGLVLEETVRLVEDLARSGLSVKGSGGNGARNVALPPEAGFLEGEVFDVAPHGLAVERHLQEEPLAFSLPRKFKIALSPLDADPAGARIADLGLIARIRDGERGFCAYAGGGLGRNPKESLLLVDFLPERRLLALVRGTLEFFAREGDWKDRSKARLRHIRDRMGDKAFGEGILAAYAATGDIPLVLEEEGIPKGRRRKGSVSLRPPGGEYHLGELEQVRRHLQELPGPVCLRLTNNQGLWVGNLGVREARRFAAAFASLRPRFPLEGSLGCVGASICSIGIGKPQETLEAVVRRFLLEPPAIRRALPALQMSGCPSSCARHQVASIGCMGRIKKIDGSPVPAYTLFLGGSMDGAGVRMGDAYGEIRAVDLPDFLVALARLKVEAGAGEVDFDRFLEEQGEAVREMADRWKV
ncbi:nitrite/sulfite reductase [Anaerotalea alkaliphila]|uniref:Nitrite/sulfite reductase n=1 Tax=Anaerotalea alkaliphila TaxID=2662126 RepID=A0A7X5HTX8_9FIRM|nr:nitrite/sulfite reductase [Anaerotalea alkaliphila]NDL66600.1 nitrite/sulfite reductase [Anaerotalea alkaliphila]